jgi:hypothetical protein
MLTERINDLQDPWHAIVDLIIIIVIIGLLWKWVGSPLFKVVLGIGKEKQHYDKSHRFFAGMPENGSPTLWERAETTEQAIAKLTLCVEEVSNKLDVFILERKPNGRRSYDPHDP